MSRIHACLFSLAAVASFLPAQTTSPTDAKRVLVIYASTYPDDNGNGVGDSKEIAEYYAKARGVPTANLLPLKIVQPKLYYYSGATGWARFHDEMVTPIKAKLKAVGATNIDTLLFCFGVPFQVTTTSTSQAVRAVDSLMRVPDFLGNRTSWGHSSWWLGNPYFEPSPTVGGDKGRFSHSNVKFRSTMTYYLVSRLDGLHVEACKDLVDGARYFETFGPQGDGKLSGNIIVDTRYGLLKDDYLKQNYPNYPGKSSYTLWDYRAAWGSVVPPTMVKLPVLWEPSGKEIGETGAKWTNGKSAARAPETILYGGWYNYNRYLDVFDWLPGSVATDLNSNSLSRFRDKSFLARSFGSGALNRGLTASLGVISEPYLSGHVRPEIMLYYMAKGYTFAEAGALSDPTVFWRGLQIGDPLYAPYRTGGYVRKKDTTQPSFGKVQVGTRTGTDAVLDVQVRRPKADPELARVEVDWGTNRKLENLLVQDRAFKARHDIKLTKLDANEPGYYFRPTLIDPAGNKTVGETWVVTPRAFSTVEAKVKIATPDLKHGGILDARFSVATTTTLENLTLFKVELQEGAITTKWLNVTEHVIGIATDPGAGPQFESVLFSMKSPFYLRGSFRLRITAGIKKTISAHTAAFTVK